MTVLKLPPKTGRITLNLAMNCTQNMRMTVLLLTITAFILAYSSKTDMMLLTKMNPLSLFLMPSMNGDTFYLTRGILPTK